MFSTLRQKSLERRKTSDLQLFNIRLKPDPPHFGCLSLGFVYKLTILISNHGTITERLNASCISTDENSGLPCCKISCSQRDHVIAAGMNTYLELELMAELPGSFSYDIFVKFSSGGQIERTVCAFVLPIDVYQAVSKSLSLSQQTMFEENVKEVRLIQTNESVQFSMVGSEFSIAHIDDEDYDDLLELPFMDTMYFDPLKRTINLDPQLLKVELNASWSLEEAMQHNKSIWAQRRATLESKGMLCKDTVDSLLCMRAQDSIISNDIERAETAWMINDKAKMSHMAEPNISRNQLNMRSSVEIPLPTNSAKITMSKTNPNIQPIKREASSNFFGTCRK